MVRALRIRPVGAGEFGDGVELVFWRKQKNKRYSQMTMSELLGAYIEKLSSKNSVVLDSYIIGNSQIDLRPFSQLDLLIPQDLRDFWFIVKGVKPNTKTTVEKTWFDGTFTYFSSSESLVDYKTWRDVCAENPELNDWYIPQGFLPIGSPGEGSRILVNCLKKSPTYGQIYELFHGVGLSKLSESLSNYFKTLLLAFDHGVSIVNGIVDVQEKKFNKIAAMVNPGCSGWYGFPQEQDWLLEEDK